MEFKGTKGKWMFNHNMVATVETITDDTICLKPYILSSNWESNALLISKAPEMLSILKQCFFELQNYRKEFGQGSNLESEIEQLIKEATELN